MAWRKPVTPARIEPPLWYRVFDPAQWDEMDSQEQSMYDGCPTWRPWPEHLHRWHSERRWQEAKYRYGQAHPQLAEQEFQDLLEEVRRRP